MTRRFSRRKCYVELRATQVGRATAFPYRVVRWLEQSRSRWRAISPMGVAGRRTGESGPLRDGPAETEPAARSLRTQPFRSMAAMAWNRTQGTAMRRSHHVVQPKRAVRPPSPGANRQRCRAAKMRRSPPNEYAFRTDHRAERRQHRASVVGMPVADSGAKLTRQTRAAPLGTS